MRIEVILMEPKRAENVGAAARAMNTMGFHHLAVVGSEAHLEPAARWVAHASEHILEHASVYPDLETAVRGADLVIGSSARSRHHRQAPLQPAELLQRLEDKSDLLTRVVLLMGREDRGLSNSELRHCDILVTIPQATDQPSLNLAQAVMILVWELRQLNFASMSRNPEQPQEGEWQQLRKNLRLLTGILPKISGSPQEAWLLQNVARLDRKGVHHAHTLCSSLLKLLRVNT